jgi:hypothetical protein
VTAHHQLASALHRLKVVTTYDKVDADPSTSRFTAQHIRIRCVLDTETGDGSVARDCKILVPKGIEEEVKIFVEEVQIAAAQTGKFNEEDIELIEPEFVQLGGAELLDSFVVYIAAPVVANVSKAWFDKHVLPLIMKRLDKVSDAFWHWYNEKFKSDLSDQDS